MFLIGRKARPQGQSCAITRLTTWVFLSKVLIFSTPVIQPGIKSNPGSCNVKKAYMKLEWP